MKVVIIFITLFTHNLFATDGGYTIVDKTYTDIANSEFLVPNMPPLKDQDGIGLCYAFSTATLLEQFTCQSKSRNCKSTSPDYRLSPLDLAGYDTGHDNVGITEGGMPSRILETLQKQKPKIAKEECAPYESLLLEKKWQEGNVTYKQNNQRVGFQKLREIYDRRASSSYDCIECAQSIQQTFGTKINLDLNEIVASLKAPTFEAFLYRLLIPKYCRDQGEALPAFEINDYPSGFELEIVTKEQLKQRLIKNLYNKIPVATSICPGGTQADCPEGGHVAVISGMKQVCSPKGCTIAFKFHNSYGGRWQEENNDGWVDGDWLAENMYNYSRFNVRRQNQGILTTITPPKFKLKDLPSNFYSTGVPTSRAPVETTKSESSTKCTKLSGGAYKCVDENGKTTFTDQPIK